MPRPLSSSGSPSASSRDGSLTPTLNRQVHTPRRHDRARDNPSSGGSVGMSRPARNNSTDVYTAEASINVDNRIPRTTTRHTYSATTTHFPFMSIKPRRSLARATLRISVLATATCASTSLSGTRLIPLGPAVRVNESDLSLRARVSRDLTRARARNLLRARY